MCAHIENNLRSSVPHTNRNKRRRVCGWEENCYISYLCKKQLGFFSFFSLFQVLNRIFKEQFLTQLYILGFEIYLYLLQLKGIFSKHNLFFKSFLYCSLVTTSLMRLICIPSILNGNILWKKIQKMVLK